MITREQYQYESLDQESTYHHLSTLLRRTNSTSLLTSVFLLETPAPVHHLQSPTTSLLSTHV